MKRDYGSGSVSQRQDGRFEVRLRVMQDGKHQRRSLGYVTTRRAAAQLLKAAHALYFTPGGRPIDRRGAGETVAAFVARWLAKAVAPGRAGTYYNYASRMRLHVLPVIGAKRLCELTRADVEDVQRHAAAQGLGPSSIRLLLVILGVALNYAVIKEEIPGARNVVKGADRLYRVKARTYTFLTADQGAALLTAAAASRWVHAYATMLYCGLRINECLALRWKDLDLEHGGRLRVEHSLAGVDGVGGYRLADVKTPASRRSIEPLPAVAVVALKAQRRAQMAEQAAAGAEGVPWLNTDGLVFCGPYGSAAGAGGVRREFLRCVAAAGLPHLRLHDLRHSCASLHLAQGTRVEVVAGILGHARPSITQDLYSHVIPSMRQDAADAIDRAFQR